MCEGIGKGKLWVFSMDFFLFLFFCVQAVLLDVFLAFYRMWMKELEGKMVGIG